MSKLTGDQAEETAAKFLKNSGHNIINRNFHSRYGEIDLISLDKETLVFTEVRYRKNEQFLNAIETIDEYKCRKIIKTSEVFLNKYKKYQSYYCRFDVIAITGEINNPAIKWIKSAFQA